MNICDIGSTGYITESFITSRTEENVTRFLKSFYLEEINPQSPGHSGAATILEHPAFNEDSNVRAIRERYGDNPNQVDALLRLLIFIEYKLVQKKKRASPWFRDALVFKPENGTRDLDCDNEGWLLYRNLWPELDQRNDKGELIRAIDCNGTPVPLGGDCMCSPLSVLRDGLELFLSRPPETDPTLAKIRNDEAYTPLFLKKEMGEDYEAPGKGSYLPVILHDMCSGNEHLSDVWAGSFLDFLKEAFSRANWIVVPKGLNGTRGLNRNIRDYWDRTMERVLATGQDSNPQWEGFRTDFQRMLHHEWTLPGDYSPKPGLQALLLDDWVYEDGDRYRPKYLQLCDSDTRSSLETWDNPGTPTTLEEWRNMVEDMTDRIRQRRERMKEILLATTEN